MASETMLVFMFFSVIELREFRRSPFRFIRAPECDLVLTKKAHFPGFDLCPPAR